MNFAAAELIPAASAACWRRGVDQPGERHQGGLQDVFKFYSIQGLHQRDFADVIITARSESLPPDLQAMVEVAMTANMARRCVLPAENAKALAEIKTKASPSSTRGGLCAGVDAASKKVWRGSRRRTPSHEGPGIPAGVRQGGGAVRPRDRKLSQLIARRRSDAALPPRGGAGSIGSRRAMPKTSSMRCAAARPRLPRGGPRAATRPKAARGEAAGQCDRRKRRERDRVCDR